jgi:hypothetical protein
MRYTQLANERPFNFLHIGQQNALVGTSRTQMVLLVEGSGAADGFERLV